jgi:hypothetical protein|tara:strand:+ start:1692 stop:2123 length:432 start_codon:yes stop_codon:yes gene_type:complete
MARKKKTRRRKPAFSILNAIEALAYSSLLTEGIAGTSLTGFLFGDSDLGMTTTSTGYDSWRGSQTLSTTITGADEISLGDLVTEPTMAINLMTKNFQNNVLPMALGAFGISVTFRIGKRLLRQPISSVNRNIIKPALGAGIRL